MGLTLAARPRADNIELSGKRNVLYFSHRMDKPLIMSYDLVYSSIKTDITFQRDCIFYDIYYNEPNK